MKQTGFVARYAITFRDVCRQSEPGYVEEELSKDLFLNDLIPNVHHKLRLSRCR